MTFHRSSRAAVALLASSGVAPLLLLVFIAGCGTLHTAAPQELLAARAACDRASQGPAAQYDPVDLDIARATLERAELWYAEDATSAETRAQAYLAERRAQTADANGHIGLADAQRAEAQRGLVHAQALALSDTRAELDRTKTRLAEIERNGVPGDPRDLAVAERQGTHPAPGAARPAAPPKPAP